MNQYPIRAVRTAHWKFIRNLDPTAEHHTHIDKGGGSGPPYWESWVKKAKDDPLTAKLIEKYHHRPAEEFYDLANDPNEEKNLIDDPASQKTSGELRAALAAWMEKDGDQGMQTERGLTLNAPAKTPGNAPSSMVK